MKNAIIFHGTGGHPKENWFPWLKSELEPLGYNVIIPQFPMPDDKTLERWFKAFEEYEKYLNEESIVIGHSLGGAFLLRVLEKFDIKVHAAYCVAAPIGVLPIKYYETDKPVIDHPFDWEKIKKNIGDATVFHSDNDPFVCIGNGEELAKNLDTKLTFVPNAGHFNESAGHTKLPLLLEKIKEEL